MSIRTLVAVFLMLLPLLGITATVKEVQEMLHDLGYLAGTADGRWGGKSREALKRFQTEQGLPATGKIDTNTTQKLEGAIQAKNVPLAQEPAPPVQQEATTNAATAPVTAIAQPYKATVEPEVATSVVAVEPKPQAQTPPIKKTPKNTNEKSTIVESPAGISFALIPGGCFTMGSSKETDTTPHEVCVHKNGSFLLGRYEITQSQWRSIMDNNPSVNGANPGYPVENISWNDAHNFIEKLNAKEQGRYRLPTEAEWEYSARAGSKTAYWWGDTLPVCEPKVAHGANFQGGLNCPNSLTPVGIYQPNQFGLYDVHGNVWEWVEDVYTPDAYTHHTPNDPVVTEGSTERVFRGGSWLYPAEAMAAFHRDHAAPAFQFSHLGLRLVYEPVSPP